MVKWLIHMKILVAAPALLVLHVYNIDCTTGQLEMVRKQHVASYRGMTVFTQQYICIWAYICQNRHLILSAYLSFNCLSLTLV